MLINHLVMSDLDRGFVGIAIQVQCQVTGDLFWLWASPEHKHAEYPPQSSFLYGGIGPDSLVIMTIRRLWCAGVISSSDLVSITDEVRVAEEQIVSFHKQRIINQSKKQRKPRLW